MNEIDRCLERCEAGLMALCHTGDVERIIEEYEEEMKSRRARRRRRSRYSEVVSSWRR